MGISSELMMPIKRQQETMSHSKILWEWGKECPDTKLCSWETVWNLIDGSLYRNGFFKVHPIASLPVHGELALLNVTSSPLPHIKPIIVHSTHYLSSDQLKAYNESSKSAPGTSYSFRLYNNHVKDTQGYK